MDGLILQAIEKICLLKTDMQLELEFIEIIMDIGMRHKSFFVDEMMKVYQYITYIFNLN